MIKLLELPFHFLLNHLKVCMKNYLKAMHFRKPGKNESYIHAVGTNLHEYALENLPL